jgi:glycosyltransferase involved in cell wall biosynthesis
VFASKPRFIDWLVDSHQLCVALNSPVFNELVRQHSKNTVWYFYWGRNPALLIPFIKKRISAHIVCRFHGYDLYKERNHGYIPYQSEIIANTDLLLPCSSDGRSYLYNNFNLSAEQVFVARLGTRFQGKATRGTGKCLNIVSCSFCVPVKRLHLIFDALEKLKISFRWTHIGDGPLFQDYQERASHFTQPDRQVCFHGYLPSESVIPFYLKGSFDIFINLSESEGVPVSIMEALSVGLPIIATDVGGTGEIVDEEVGFLVDKNIAGVELAALLEGFAKLPVHEIQKLREGAVNRFSTLCDSDNNALQLIKKIQETFEE